MYAVSRSAQSFVRTGIHVALLFVHVAVHVQCCLCAVLFMHAAIRTCFCSCTMLFMHTTVYETAMRTGTWGPSRTGVSRGNRPIIVPLACDCVIL